MCAASVRRVVVTSSIRAVFGFGNEKPQGYVYGEDDWNETSTLENNQAYSLSKTLAEVSEPSHAGWSSVSFTETVNRVGDSLLLAVVISWVNGLYSCHNDVCTKGQLRF